MARNGSGAYSLPSGNPVVTGAVISSTWANTTLSDIATALTNSIAKDGQTTPTANLPMGGFKLTGLGAATSAGDALRHEQLFNSSLTLSGDLTVPGAINGARGTVAMHATTMDLWAQPNIIDGTGSSVTITDIADAPQAGAVRTLYPVAGTVITYGATFDVDGGTNYTTAAGDALIFEAVTTSTFKVHIVKADGTPVVSVTTAQIQPISASVGSNALTISASDLSLDFRSTTLGSGTVTRVTGTPSNLVISSGSTLGTANGVASDIAVLAINNAGTIELAAVNMAGGVNLDETGLISTTAEGGAGGADSATTVYSTTARTNVAYRVVGIVRSTQATAGTWATAPALIQGAGGLALSSMGSLGYGQRWQTVTRTAGTTYYSGSRPRKLRVVGQTTNNAAGQVTIQFSNGTIFSLVFVSGPTTNGYAGETLIPANESYVLNDVNILNRTSYEMF